MTKVIDVMRDINMLDNKVEHLIQRSVQYLSTIETLKKENSELKAELQQCKDTLESCLNVMRPEEAYIIQKDLLNYQPHFEEK